MHTKSHYRETVDRMDPLQPAYYGTFERTVEIGGAVRRYLYYVPDGVTPSTAGVMLLPPDGVTADEFLERSTWRMLCEMGAPREKFILCVLEAPNGWQSDEVYGDPAGDVAYIEAVVADFAKRKLFCVNGSKHYMVGYGAGAAAAQRGALYNPARYSGLACVASEAVSPAYREAAIKASCYNLFGLEDAEGRLGIRKGDVALPVWMIARNTANDVACWNDLRAWCTRSGAVLQHGRVARDTVTFVREASAEYPANQDREAYRVWNSLIPDALENYGASVNYRIWKDFLSGVRRWMSEPGGSLRLTEDPITDLNCEYHYELVGGWMREWYVYIPRKVRDNPLKPAPVVFANHGYNWTGGDYIGWSGWNRVADRYGFIVIAGTAVPGRIFAKEENRVVKFDNAEMPTWNVDCRPDRPNELIFFQHMFDELRGRVLLDEERVYATGHSWGNMMTQYLAMAMPNNFAAIAPCSGILFGDAADEMPQKPTIKKTADSDVPVWMFAGECEGWLIPHIPEGDNPTAKTIRLWWKRNDMEGAAPQTFDEGWSVKGRWNELTYMKDLHPMLRYTWIRDFPHATMPEQSERIWADFFSRVRKEKGTGILRWAD